MQRYLKLYKSTGGDCLVSLAERVPIKRGGLWYPGTIRYILDNPKYQGYVEYYFRWDGENYVLPEGKQEVIVPKAR